MPALAPAHWLALILVLVPDTLNVETLDGLELVANARLSPVQLPLVDQLNVCGNVIEAPLEGLLSVAVHAASARDTAPIVSAPETNNNKKNRPPPR